MTLSSVARQLGALVVDFLDVALGARRADDVGRIGDPLLQPVEALAAHAGRQHGHAAAAENARDRNAAAAVVAGRRPDRAVVRRIELPGHQARHQAGIGGEHLVRADHRKATAEQHDDRRLHAGQFARQHDMAGHRHAALRLASLNQCTRQRLAASGASGFTWARSGDVSPAMSLGQRARSRSAARPSPRAGAQLRRACVQRQRSRVQ